MKLSRWPLALVLLALPLAGCSGGEECDKCDSDDDCKSGFVCSNFLDSSGKVVEKRCGSGIGATQCRVR